MLNYITSGESHGQYLAAILEGIPSGLSLDLKFINEQLSRRQQGYGRGGRQKIETDAVDIIGGVVKGDASVGGEGGGKGAGYECRHTGCRH